MSAGDDWGLQYLHVIDHIATLETLAESPFRGCTSVCVHHLPGPGSLRYLAFSSHANLANMTGLTGE